MFRILIVLVTLFVLTAPAAEASRYHRTRPAWRAKPSAIQVRVAPSSRIRLVVKRPPRPGPRYTWRASRVGLAPPWLVSNTGRMGPAALFRSQPVQAPLSGCDDRESQRGPPQGHSGGSGCGGKSGDHGLCEGAVPRLPPISAVVWPVSRA